MSDFGLFMGNFRQISAFIALDSCKKCFRALSWASLADCRQLIFGRSGMEL